VSNCDPRHRSHLASDDTIRPPACPEIVLVCNEDVKPLRLQRIKHLALQCLLNFHSNNHNNVMPIRIELNENVNVIHYVFQKGMIILEEITPDNVNQIKLS
jgi:hypothetical protein